jgi:manganese-dependent inorganic pyrophosphatase
LPVVDDSGRLLGLISRREALAPPRRGLVLVDHFERSQSIRGVEACEILEIIDHHRIGALETIEPARVDCRPLGSTSTIIALRYEEAGLPLGSTEAMLLLGAIAADTLALTSPTTTETDRRIAASLASQAGVVLAEFGREVLAQNDGLANEPAAALVHRDLKEFERGETRFLLGQIETIDLRLLTDPRREQLLEALEGARVQAGAAFALTMVTDVLAGVTRLLGVDPETGRLRHLLEGEDGREGRPRANMVSRKKQLLPLILRRLGEWKS